MTQPARRDSTLFRVAIIGAATLKGKEVREVLTERNFPSIDVKLLDDEESLGQLEAVNDEPTFIQSVMPESLEGVDFAFLTANESYIARTWTLARDAGTDIIDLSYALENNTNVHLRAPWVERELGQTPRVELESAPVVVAHPAAVTLALLMMRLNKAAPLAFVSAVIGEPASEHGRPGMDELHDQTVNLLSFQQMPTNVFGTQVAFNLVAQPILGSQLALPEIEARILRHYQAITRGTLPQPSIMLVQTPVFHAHTFALYVRPQAELSLETLTDALAGAHLSIIAPDGDMPSNVNVAGSSDIQVSVRADAGGNGFWLWAACDNLRLTSLLAVECAEEMLATRPRGQLQ